MPTVVLLITKPFDAIVSGADNSPLLGLYVKLALTLAVVNEPLVELLNVGYNDALVDVVVIVAPGDAAHVGALEPFDVNT